jgi:sugar phosphate permease
VALGLILASYANSLWMLYVAYGLVFAIGYCGVGELSHVPVISRWFVRKRGMAIGLAMAGMGLGILLVVPLAQTFILHFGWRRAYVALAIVVLLGIIPPTLLWQRERPEDMGLLPDGEQRQPPPLRPTSAASPAMGHAATQKEWTLRQALGSTALWMLFVVRILTPLGMMMVVPHHVVYLVGQGFDKLMAAFAFGSLGAFSFTGRILFGWLSDRLGTVQTMMLSYSISIVGTFLLLSLHNPAHTWLLWCHIVVYGIGFGARGPTHLGPGDADVSWPQLGRHPGVPGDWLRAWRHHRPLAERLSLRPHRQLYPLIQPVDGAAWIGYRLCLAGWPPVAGRGAPWALRRDLISCLKTVRIVEM